MSRKLDVLLDGTGNQIGANLSNVLKFYRMLDQDDDPAASVTVAGVGFRGEGDERRGRGGQREGDLLEHGKLLGTGERKRAGRARSKRLRPARNLPLAS